MGSLMIVQEHIKNISRKTVGLQVQRGTRQLGNKDRRQIEPRLPRTGGLFLYALCLLPFC